MEFNPAIPTIMHVDINSCFATIEQQSNKSLRDRPLVVAAYKSSGGCILAASLDAKKLGIKTGMRVREGLAVCKDLIVLEPDPVKYQKVHLQLRRLLYNYTPNVWPKSIDEFALDLSGCPALKAGLCTTARAIKGNIRRYIGDYITVSIGIGPNRFLAKTACSLHKPDGLDEITKANFTDVYQQLALQDLHGIARNNAARLSAEGIYTVLDFYHADSQRLNRVFHSISGYYWYLRLRGWEIDSAESARKSFGNSYALPKPLYTMEELAPILTKLVEKMCFRLHAAGFTARGVGIFVNFRDGGFWHKTSLLPEPLYESRDFFNQAYKILSQSPYKRAIKVLAVSCYSLEDATFIQPDLFGLQEKKFNLAKAVDSVNAKWGKFVVGPAGLLLSKTNVRDRIAFGGVRELV